MRARMPAKSRSIASWCVSGEGERGGWGGGDGGGGGVSVSQHKARRSYLLVFRCVHVCVWAGGRGKRGGGGDRETEIETEREI
jgi:hypothetical protein